MPTKAPRGTRLLVTLTGTRNVGKSSLINALIEQDVSIVSDTAGTTTDPVAKHYELLPLGPVTFYDTPGLDDEGELGQLRVKATQKILWRTDVAIIVIGEKGITHHEQKIIERVRQLKIPFLLVFNKADLRSPSPQEIAYCKKEAIAYLKVSALTKSGIKTLRQSLIELAPAQVRQQPILVRDLFKAGDPVVCVTPIDLSAPKGRLILPQVQVLRDILDGNGIGIISKQHELQQTLKTLATEPALVIADSQVIRMVAKIVPGHIPLTTFSTLFARYKGELPPLIAGAQALETLCDGDTILIGEACSHHAMDDDIGRVKIPRWIQKYTGKDIKFEVFSGYDFPDNLERFSLVVHCGACMLNHTEMRRRINECMCRGVPITNYGIAISKVQQVLERIIAPFSSHNESEV